MENSVFIPVLQLYGQFVCQCLAQRRFTSSYGK